MKIGQTFNLKFDRECHVMVFVVHSHLELQTPLVVCSRRSQTNTSSLPSICPFTASSGTNDVYYKPLEDKTFGDINVAVLKVDSWMNIRPTKISGNECNTNQEQIGNECFNFNIFQFDTFLVKVNSS